MQPPEPEDVVPEEEPDGDMQAEKPAPRTYPRGGYWDQVDEAARRPATPPVEPEETADEQP
jgi:hypothetical protein